MQFTSPGLPFPHPGSGRSGQRDAMQGARPFALYQGTTLQMLKKGFFQVGPGFSLDI
jgi:hypothetical protein